MLDAWEVILCEPLALKLLYSRTFPRARQSSMIKIIQNVDLSVANQRAFQNIVILVLNMYASAYILRPLESFRSE